MYNKAKVHKIYSLIIKLVVIVVACLYIYWRMFVKENIGDTIRSFHSISINAFIYILIPVFLLMFLNWGIESIKWKYLIKKIETVPFTKSLIAVLTGITVSIFTPNRVGEFAGRVFVLEKADRWKAVVITILGNFGQLLVTIIAGAIGFLFFAKEYINPGATQEYYFYGLLMIVVIMVILLLLLFFNVSFLTNVVNRLPAKLNKVKQYGDVFSLYTKKELLLILLFSLGRYIIFIAQFYLLLLLFGVDIPLSETIMMTAMIYLVMAAIPTFAFTELGIRGSVAVYFIGMYFDMHNLSGGNDLGILAATTVLWFINLAIPALIGAVLIFKLKFFRKD
ncbi:MAG: lysylphosphatidylglycerol synthase domain-containing protein [Bacteroidales bacterium]